MAHQKHLDILGQGVKVWNGWREQNPGIRPDLSQAHLCGVNLTGANLSGADLALGDRSDSASPGYRAAAFRCHQRKPPSPAGSFPLG